MTIIQSPALTIDAAAFAPLMRRQDQDEVRRWTGLTPEQALAASIASSSEALAVRDTAGRYVFIAGLVDAPQGFGVPWMLSTDLIHPNRLAVYKLCRDLVTRWSTLYPLLANAIDPANSVARKLVKQLGFKEVESVTNSLGTTTFLAIRKVSTLQLQQGNRAARRHPTRH